MSNTSLEEVDTEPSTPLSHMEQESISQPFKFSFNFSSTPKDKIFIIKENIVGDRDVVFDILFSEKPKRHLNLKLKRISQRLSDVLICNCSAEMFSEGTANKIFDKLWFRPSTLVAGVNKGSFVHSVKMGWVLMQDVDTQLKQHKFLTIVISGLAVYKKESSFLKHVNTYLENNKDETSDITLKVRDRTFRGHKWVLTARSPFFKTKFEKEIEDQKEVSVDDIEPNVFEEILHYMYHDTCPKLRAMAADLLIPADILGLVDLKLLCGEELIKHVNPRNVSTYLMLGSDANVPQLYEKCWDYVYENVTDVVLTDTWKKFRSTADVTFGFKFAERIATRQQLAKK